MDQANKTGFVSFPPPPYLFFLPFILVGNHIIFKMGSDFQYENANEWFKNLDKLLYYVNQDGRVNAFYSTPTAFVQTQFLKNP